MIGNAAAHKIQDRLDQIAIDLTAGKTPMSVFSKRIRELLDSFTQIYRCIPSSSEITAYASPLIQRVANRLEKAREWAKIPLPFKREDYAVFMPVLNKEMEADFQIKENLYRLIDDAKKRKISYRDLIHHLKKCIKKFQSIHELKESPLKGLKLYPHAERGKIHLSSPLFRSLSTGLADELQGTYWWFTRKTNPAQFRKRSSSCP
jgi:hypothetical protein